MNHRSDFPMHAGSRKVAQVYLKRCPLCDALNAATNRDCFVCGWHCTFDRDPYRLEESLLHLISECPAYTESAPRRLGWWDHVRWQFRRHIDRRV